MTRICPKCRYARQPGDEAPEWQCPSCGVAYAKVGAPAASPRGGMPPPDAPSALWPVAKWAVLLALGGIAIWRSDWLLNTVSDHARSAGTISSAAEQPEVILYSAEWCGYCTATRQFFVANDIRFTEHDVEKTTAGYEGHKALGGDGVPLIVAGDTVIRGYNKSILHSTFETWLPKK